MKDAWRLQLESEIGEYVQHLNAGSMIETWEWAMRRYRIQVSTVARVAHVTMPRDIHVFSNTHETWMRISECQKLFGDSQMVRVDPSKIHGRLEGHYTDAGSARTAHHLVRAGRNAKRFGAVMLAASINSRLNAKGNRKRSIELWPNYLAGRRLLEWCQTTFKTDWHQASSILLPEEEMDDDGVKISNLEQLIMYFAAEHARTLLNHVPVLFALHRKWQPDA